MNINHQSNINAFQTYSVPDGNKMAKGSALSGNKDHVNALISKSEIKTKHIEKEQKSLKRKEELLEDRVAFSKDGDTIQISKDGALKYHKKQEELSEKKRSIQEELKENEVKKDEAKAKEQKAKIYQDEIKEAKLKQEAREERRKLEEAKAKAGVELLQNAEDEEKEQPQEVSFVGKSDSDLAKMYLRGDISKAMYDSELKSREEKREAIGEKEREQRKEIHLAHSRFEDMALFEEEIKMAFSDRASKTLGAKERLETIEAAEGERKKDQEKRILFSMT